LERVSRAWNAPDGARAAAPERGAAKMTRRNSSSSAHDPCAPSNARLGSRSDHRIGRTTCAPQKTVDQRSLDHRPREQARSGSPARAVILFVARAKKRSVDRLHESRSMDKVRRSRAARRARGGTPLIYIQLFTRPRYSSTWCVLSVHTLPIAMSYVRANACATSSESGSRVRAVATVNSLLHARERPCAMCAWTSRAAHDAAARA
jgi:hypothetical protein